ncbi:MAG: hypothetical protein AB1772_10290 [Candidatus Zixiibacteriota bacterium]
MPYCPECAFEYGRSILVCPECKISLVDQLPGGAAAVSPDDSWIRICQIGSDLTSQVVRGLLETNNIPSIVMSSAFQPLANGVGWVAGGGNSTDGGHYLMVPREFRQEVELLLSAVLGDDFEALDAPKP